MPKTLTIRRPDDFHVHFRQGDLLSRVLPFTVRWFRRALVMPNLKPPILTAPDVQKYREEIEAALKKDSLNGRFKPLMTIKINQSTSVASIREAALAGALAGKAYPAGEITTNSEDGITDFREKADVFREMARVGMVLCLHGEKPGAFCLNREAEFLDILDWLIFEFPGLKIVLEHVTTEKAVRWIMASPSNVGATITAHHLVLTLDDVVGGEMKPHNFCKPLPKTAPDRDALIKAACSGSPKFFFGSDSAPHPIDRKHSCSIPSGVFSAPIALELLAQVFEEHNALEQLEDFVSKFGADFYGLPPNTGTITLERKPLLVPPLVNGLVPFMAEKLLNWRLTGGSLQ